MMVYGRSRILITGASGFVGSALLKRMETDTPYTLVAALRRPAADLAKTVNTVQVCDLSADTDWSVALEDVEVVIHAAGRAHIMQDVVADSLAEFRRVNVAGTLQLAEQAVEAGVSRFIFISSIGVNGNQSTCPFTERDAPNPKEPYAVSKLEAEQALRLLAEESGMELVIIRPPLVYGPNAPGKFERLIKILCKGMPLPLGAIHNKRSLVALDNLVDLIITCVEHPAAANQTFLVSDGHDLSTTELLKRLGDALGKPTRLLPVPMSWILFGAGLLGKRAIAQRLCGSLQVDTSKARELLCWTPPVSVDEALKKTAKAFLQQQRD